MVSTPSRVITGRAYAYHAMSCRTLPNELAFMAKIGYMRILDEPLAVVAFTINIEEHRYFRLSRLFDAKTSLAFG